MAQTQAWNKYQENRDLIDAFKRQADGPNYGITFAMYRQARTQAEQYERARYTQEGTGCPYWIDWDKPEGKSESWRDSIKNSPRYDDDFNDDWLDDYVGVAA